MEGQNQGRTVLAATLLTAALLFATMRAVESAPFADWGLPILLFIAAIVVVLSGRFGWRLVTPAPEYDGEPEPASPPLAVAATHTYRVSAAAPVNEVVSAEASTAAPAPINTMFIRPERAADAADEAPSTSIPLETATEPAATPGFTARTESAPAEPAATLEKPADLPPAAAEVETTHEDPVKESVVEKTAAPQQAYEAANTAMLTPAEVERVVTDQPSETAANITEPASPEIAAAETDLTIAVGSADDLEIVEGIGPKIAAALRAAGIDSFPKLANTPESQLKDILTEAKVRYPGTTLPYWAHQAAYAARQDWDGFKKYNAERRSGGDD